MVLLLLLRRFKDINICLIIEMNNKIVLDVGVVGGLFIEEFATDRPLPGIPTEEDRKLNQVPSVRTVNTGWTRVVNKRRSRYRRNGGWIGTN